MLVYPQLAQLPIVKRVQRRTLVNRMGDDRAIKLADAGGQSVVWQLQYHDLTRQEADVLQSFFEKAAGSLESFTFVDPTANLLTSSEQFDGAAWLKDPWLTVSSEAAGWRITNEGAAPQRMTQTIAIPPGFTLCFSLYLKSDISSRINLVAGSALSERALTSEWRRLMVTREVDEPTFGFELPPGASVEARDLQVEAQAGASMARAGGAGGIHEGARFRDDALDLIATGVDRYMCTVNIIHADHI